MPCRTPCAGVHQQAGKQGNFVPELFKQTCMAECRFIITGEGVKHYGSAGIRSENLRSSNRRDIVLLEKFAHQVACFAPALEGCAVGEIESIGGVVGSAEIDVVYYLVCEKYFFAWRKKRIKKTPS